MAELIKWWVLFEIIGWIILPICFAFFNNQFDKGYSFSKTIALLIWGYIFWVGNTFGIIGNTQAGSIFSLLLILAFSIFITIKRQLFNKMCHWIKDNKKTILIIEVLFLGSIIFMALMRGANPEIIGTEKPMELTFINGILKSNSFPPNDPWLSEYSISYYYFGYLIVSAIIKVIGTSSGVAFNLALIFWFALISIGSYGIVLNLLAGKTLSKYEKINTNQVNKIFLFSLLAPIFLLIVSNAEGLLELIHSLGIFWDTDPVNGMDSIFWRWLDIKELTQIPPVPLDWKIGRNGGTWWWRASRVLQDYTLLGQSREVIDEFPFFSFFLGDLHPHVLAMPFVLLSIFTGYAFLNRNMECRSTLFQNMILFWKNKFNWFFAFVNGSLIFLNTWDFPIYFGMVAILMLLKVVQKKDSIRKVMINLLALLFSYGVICIMLFFPFILSFSSQAGGILPSLIFQSRSVHLLTMFFPFFVIITVYLVTRYGKAFSISNILRNWVIVFITFLGVYIISILIPIILEAIPNFYTLLQNITGNSYQSGYQHSLQNYLSFLSIYEAENSSQLINAALSRMLADPVDILILLSCLSVVITIGTSFLRSEDQKVKNGREDIFIGCLLFLGIGLILFPEVFYLRDQFGWRMNTIFKFYFQVWILFSICSAYAIGQTEYIKRYVIKIAIMSLSVLGILAGLIYPITAIKERMDTFSYKKFTLDGNQYLQDSNPDEWGAVEQLNLAESGIVSEAVGGSYTHFGRISKLTGFPTVLGWPGHELQWRGGSEEIGTRESDIKELYSSNSWETAKNILDRYNIRYVYIGDLERSAYQVSEEKFITSLPVYFTNRSVTIYEYKLEQ